MNSRLWNSGHKSQSVMEVEDKARFGDMKTSSTAKPDYGPCLSSGYRRCSDGSCIARVDLCPEEQMMNQNTILIMVVVGMAVVIFLIILYCFQQRSQRLNRNSSSNQGTFESVAGDGDNASLNLPPPTYEEVITTNLYPPTPNAQRNPRTSATSEPRTPPPNYDAALHILAHSHDSMFPSKEEPKSPVVRRSVSTEFGTRSQQSSEVDYRRIFSTPDHR